MCTEVGLLAAATSYPNRARSRKDSRDAMFVISEFVISDDLVLFSMHYFLHAYGHCAKLYTPYPTSLKIDIHRGIRSIAIAILQSGLDD